nr:low molecular weight protein-tyrosine-phosphatase [uncultured Albidiferax sp.]
MSTYSVLFVCMGNICRSPTAHGVFRQKVLEQGLEHWVKVDSAGTHNYHPGSSPDTRSQAHASKRGYNLSDLRARQIQDADYENHDLILVMDWDNLALVQSESPSRHHPKIRRLTEFCETHNGTMVPDPYYGDECRFEEVLDLVEDACNGLLKHLQRHWTDKQSAVTVR